MERIARRQWVEERLYVGGYEVYRKRRLGDGSLELERQTLGVMDGERRVALGEGGTRLETLQELHRAYQWLREDPKIQERLTELRGQMAGAGGTAGEESIDAKPPSKEGLERLGYTSEQRKALYGAIVERRERLQAAYEKGWWKGFAYTTLALLALEAGGAVALAGTGRTVATTAARQLAPARAMEAASLTSRLPFSAQLGVHVAGRMGGRGITQRMVDIALRRGSIYWDPVNTTIQFVVQPTSGKNFSISLNPVTRVITTTQHQTKNLVRPRFVEISREAFEDMLR